jgi:hypothetical protein
MMEYKDGSKLLVQSTGGQAGGTLQRLIAEARRDPNIVSVKSVGPNAPCPCGSGKKFKKCCMYKGITRANVL